MMTGFRRCPYCNEILKQCLNCGNLLPVTEEECPSCSNRFLETKDRQLGSVKLRDLHKSHDFILATNSTINIGLNSNHHLEIAERVGNLGKLQSMRNSQLNGQDLSYQDFRGFDFYNANLIGAQLIETNFSEADLSSAKLRGASLERARLTHANLQHADLSAANLEDALLVGAQMHGVSLQNAILSRANLSSADLRYSKLYHADLQDAVLIGALLYNVDLREAILTRADFSEARLDKAMVEERQLHVLAYLRGATLPDGTLYDGRYGLYGDIEWAKRNGIDVNNHEALAAFFAVV